jgi:DnaJ-class molecular chaperone
MMKDQTSPPAQPPCTFCHGSGEICSFKGVSRFLLTAEECPHCSGTGLEPPPTEETQEENGK